MNDSVAAPERSVSALCPATVPSVHPAIVTVPALSDVAEVGAVSAVAVSSIGATATGLSNASVTRALTPPATASPARPLNDVGASGMKCAAGPERPIAEKESGATSGTDTTRVFTRACGPNVHSPTDVDRLDVRAGTLASFPPPDATLIETLIPEIAAPFASYTTNCGAAASVVPAAADCPSPETTRIPAGLAVGPVESWHAAPPNPAASATKAAARDLRTNFKRHLDDS